jgi:F-box/WD-40 domain protein 5
MLMDDSEDEVEEEEINKDDCDDEGSEEDMDQQPQNDKYLIFTTGFKTYTPHQIGFKRIQPFTFPKRIDPGPSLKERLILRERKREQLRSGSPPPEPNWLDFDSVADKFDKVDHVIDLHGHIVGMGLSPDHRYLYVNSRSWPEGYKISNPLDPPPIAQEIDIHVIDLVTLKQVGTMLRAHKAYTSNSECFFIFLDVCSQYVASGAEDKHGYLWDRHYGMCLVKYPHADVVNSVAFNPKDPEMLVTTSDDHTIKVWRSRSKVRELNLNEAEFERGVEFRRNQTKDSKFKSACGVKTRSIKSR